jgi:hypothetical protein
VFVGSAEYLFGMYNEGYKPPQWIRKYMVKKDSTFLNDARRSRCYSLDERVGDIQKVLTERQPVNMTMNNRGYDGNLMHSTFGFGGTISGYTDIIKSQLIGPDTRLPPNISVYCYTPIDNGKLANSKEYPREHRHVMNSIGVALDAKNQPDYEVLLQKPVEERLSEIRRVVRESYQCLLACARDLELTKIAICHLGGGAFSAFFSYLCGGDYMEKVWLPVVSILLNEEGRFLTKIRLLSAKTKQEWKGDLKSLNALLKKGICKVTHGDRIPDAAFKGSSKGFLFQNAWDPHSIAGNGNTSDNSLDGFFGRSSAISVLTFPITNPFISLRLLSKPSLFPLSRLMSESLWISID